MPKKKFFDFGKMKEELFKKKKELKLPKFKISKKELIVLPEGKEIDFEYSLIPPFASANLKWDKTNKELIYNLIEPDLIDKEKQLYEKIIEGLLEILDVELSSIKKGNTISYLEEQVKKVITEYDLKVADKSFLKIMYYIHRNFVGLNEIEPLMQDPYIEDISCDGVNVPLYIVHRKYGSIKTNLIYKDGKQLQEFVTKLAERSGRFISYAEPLLDGSLPDGSRVQASFSKDITTKGPTFTIRKFVEEPLSPIDLINNGTVNSETLAYLWLAVESGASVLVAGGAATGKTTLLNVLSMFIPTTAKVISIEDTRELNLTHENWIPSVTRVGFAKGLGEVTMFELLKESFRQSPNYVIVGEVRGKEAYVMFQGMAAGFPAMGTMHAGKVEDVIHRLETPPINLSPTLIETLDVVVIMVHARTKGKTARRVKEIIEIESVDTKTGVARTNKVFNWLASEDKFEYRGYSWLLQELSKLRGTSINDLQKEIIKRKKILDYMKKKKMKHFKEVSKFISDYYKDPEKILKGVK
jgi:flagellar protein FlaI